MFKRSSYRSFWNRIILQLPNTVKERRHSLGFLNVSQFLGILNDNIFKLVMVFLLIDARGVDKANTILATTGAIYVIPFLLFSASAGLLADRISKQRLIFILKAGEIGIMTIALFAFAFKSEWGSFALLFLLSVHSALFSPSKYGIIPELVPKENVSKANGLITSFTYLAMILGTFLASFLTETTGHNFVLIAGFCLFIAILGFAASWRIKPTPPQGSKKKINTFFLQEVYQTLKFCRNRKHLLCSIFGASYFLFIGAFTQLNIIPYAIQSLDLEAADGGYLFLSTALGIACGSFIAGKASKKQIELGISGFAGLVMACLFFFLSVFSTHLITVIILLFALGVCGGLYIVPFESYNQIHSTDEKRGQVIATANLLSFTGVLLASCALYFLSSILGLSSAKGFAVIGIITLAVSLALILRLSDLFFHYLSLKLIIPFCKLETAGLEHIKNPSSTILIMEDSNRLKALLLSGIFPNIRFLIPQKQKNKVSLTSCFYSLSLIKQEDNLNNYLEHAKNYLNGEEILCLLIKEPVLEEKKDSDSIWNFFPRKEVTIVYVRIGNTEKRVAKAIFAKE